MTPEQITELVHAIILLISAVTVWISLGNQSRMKALHEKIDAQAKKIDALKIPDGPE